MPGGLPLRLPAHRASSATLAGAYPFLVPSSCSTGVLVGTDALTEEPSGPSPPAPEAAAEEEEDDAAAEAAEAEAEAADAEAAETGAAAGPAETVDPNTSFRWSTESL